MNLSVGSFARACTKGARTRLEYQFLCTEAPVTKPKLTSIRQLHKKRSSQTSKGTGRNTKERNCCCSFGVFDKIRARSGQDICTVRLALMHSARINVFLPGIGGIHLVNIYPGRKARPFSHPSSAYASINAYPNVFNPNQWVAVMWKSMSTFSQIDSVEWRHLPPASGNSAGNRDRLYYHCIHSHKWGWQAKKQVVEQVVCW